MLIQIGALNGVAVSQEMPILPLRIRTVQQSRIPGERHAERSTIGQTDDEAVRLKQHRLGDRIFFKHQSGHAKPQGAFVDAAQRAARFDSIMMCKTAIGSKRNWIQPEFSDLPIPLDVDMERLRPIGAKKDKAARSIAEYRGHHERVGSKWTSDNYAVATREAFTVVRPGNQAPPPVDRTQLRLSGP